MSKLPPNPSSSRPNNLPESLTDRVVARVTTARLAIERTAERPKSKRRGKVAQGADSQSQGELRETQSLKRVFRDLGTSYRRYRSQTGDPVLPALRDAAYKFRADPSLTSLVAVAAYLDELDLLS